MSVDLNNYGLSLRVLDKVQKPSFVRTSNPIRYGRVLKVILDNTDERWKDLGCSKALYGLYYVPLYSGEKPEEQSTYNFAYCGQDDVKRIPIKNEIVLLSSRFDAALSGETGKYEEVICWTDILSVWNTPHLNTFPDQELDGDKAADTGKFFKEQGNIYPLFLCPGDVALEGRYGQSIRFGGTDYEQDYSPIANEQNNGKPYTIIRNGQSDINNLPGRYKFDSEGVTYAVNEFVDGDTSSIYLTSDHNIPLTEANSKRSAWKTVPVESSKYTGAQVLSSSDRIVLNARKQDACLLAKESVVVAGKNVGIDAEDQLGLDGKRVYLGSSAVTLNTDSQNQPVLRGLDTKEWLEQLCDQLVTLLNTMSTPGDSKSWIGPVTATAASVKATIESHKKEIESLLSKKVFTE